MDIKQVVKDKYGQAALRVTLGGSSCCGSNPATGYGDPITSNLYDARKQARFQKKHCWPHSVVGIRPHLRS